MPAWWVGFTSCVIAYDTVQSCCTEACWLPLSQAPQMCHLGWGWTCVPARGGPARHCLSEEQHAWLLEHLFSTTEMQHPGFVWARCKCLLRNSPWERDISHDRATCSRWPTVLFATLVTALSSFFFLEATSPISHSGHLMHIHLLLPCFWTVSLQPLDKSLLVFLFYHILTYILENNEKETLFDNGKSSIVFLFLCNKLNFPMGKRFLITTNKLKKLGFSGTGSRVHHIPVHMIDSRKNMK